MASSSNIDVYVKLPTGRTMTFDLKPSDTIATVCNKIAADESVPQDRVQLKYTGKVLNRTHTLGYLGVRPETILKAEIIQVREWQVFVKHPEGRTFAIQLENVSPVHYLMDKIHTETTIDPVKQNLKLGGQVLKKNQSLLQAGVTDEAIIELTIKEAKATKGKALFKKSASKSGSTESLSDRDDSVPEEAATADVPSLSEEDKEKVLDTFDAAGRNVEVVFCFDTTGSMYSCLDQVRQKLRETVSRLLREIPTMRIGIMAHGDYCDYNNYVEKHMDLTSDVDALVEFVRDVGTTGGGDTPECYEWALHKAQGLDWSEDAAKAFVMIGDCEPHPPSYTDQQIFWKDEVDLLAGMGVKVYGVRALSHLLSQPFYEEIAERTGGAYISFNNFSIITEMFLAVCYREASNEQYEQYCQEVMQDDSSAAKQEVDNKKEDVKEMIKQLDEQATKPKEKKTNRNHTYAWWDPKYDNNSRPQYTYDQQTDKWSTITTRHTYSATPSSSTSGYHTVLDHPRSASTKRSSSIMKRFSIRKSRPASTRTSSASDSRKKGCILM